MKSHIFIKPVFCSQICKEVTFAMISKIILFYNLIIIVVIFVNPCLKYFYFHYYYYWYFYLQIPFYLNTDISLKVNIIAQMGFELTYYNVTVQHLSHYINLPTDKS